MPSGSEVLAEGYSGKMEGSNKNAHASDNRQIWPEAPSPAAAQRCQVSDSPPRMTARLRGFL